MAGIYVISKVEHVQMWRMFRREGFPIISSWIDEWEEIAKRSYQPNWLTRTMELQRCSSVIILSNDNLGQLQYIEIGMAIAFERNIYSQGTYPCSNQLSDHPQFLRRSFPDYDIRRILTEAKVWDATGIADEVRKARYGASKNPS